MTDPKKAPQLVKTRIVILARRPSWRLRSLLLITTSILLLLASHRFLLAPTETAFAERRGRISPYSDDYDYCEATIPQADWASSASSDYELKQVHLLVRHGDRSPVSILYDARKVTWDECTSQEYREYSLSNALKGPEMLKEVWIPENRVGPMIGWNGNCFMGQLTERGYAQHVELGKRLREIYVDRLKFLPWSSLWAGDAFRVRSTDVQRTIQSANGIMKGLYPGYHPDFLKNSASTTIVHPKHLEALIPGNLVNRCPRLKEMYKKSIPHSKGFQKFFEHIEDDLERVKDILGIPADSEDKRHHDLIPFSAEDPIRARLCWDKPMPCNTQNSTDCISHDQAEEIFSWAVWQQAYNHGEYEEHEHFNRLLMGAFFEEWLDSLEYGRHKFYVYAAHDSTLLAFLGAMESQDLRWPPYRSNIIFEVWQSKDDSAHTVVRALYNGKPLPTKWCDFDVGCDWDTFMDHLTKYVPADYKEDCEPQGS